MVSLCSLHQLRVAADEERSENMYRSHWSQRALALIASVSDEPDHDPYWADAETNTAWIKRVLLKLEGKRELEVIAEALIEYLSN